MSDRYYVPHRIVDSSIELSGPEAHHLAVVARGRPGQTVTLFDGSGCEFTARIVSARRDEVRLEILCREQKDRELPGRLVLASALPKGDRSRQLVEKAVELGVQRFVPLLTERSVVRPRQIRSERLERAVIEASKQCGRNVLMEIAAPTLWVAFLAVEHRPAVRLLADPTVPLLESGFTPGQAALGEVTGITLAVGPEGGFTDAEVALAEKAGWSRYSLGPRILRIETAAIALCSLAAITLARSAGCEATRERNTMPS